MARPEVKREYAAWLCLDKRTKIALSLPLTNEDFAADKGVDTRTLRRWKGESDFQELVEQKKVQLAKETLPNSAVAAVGPPRPATDARTRAKLQPPRPATAADDPLNDPELPADERAFLQIKDTLAEMARGGNHGAIDLWMKHFGKGFIEAEKQQDSEFASMSDDELALAVMEMVGPERLASFFADQASVEL